MFEQEPIDDDDDYCGGKMLDEDEWEGEYDDSEAPYDIEPELGDEAVQDAAEAEEEEQWPEEYWPDDYKEDKFFYSQPQDDEK